jgi:tRNA A-37 threonylcarbamoyl transferase component Bud32
MASHNPEPSANQIIIDARQPLSKLEDPAVYSQGANIRADAMQSSLEPSEGDFQAMTTTWHPHIILRKLVSFVFLALACADMVFLGCKGIGHNTVLITLSVVLMGLMPSFISYVGARKKGVTRLCLSREEAAFQTTLGPLVLLSKRYSWHDIHRVYIANADQTDSRKACIRFDSVYETFEMPLNAIGSEKWRKLVSAVNEWGPRETAPLDPDMLDSVTTPRKDYSYTQLWLDALAAPPKRERLQPLGEGARLQNGDYVVSRHLGGGGQGNVYLAHSKQYSTVVLKEYVLPTFVDVRVRRQALQQFEHEAMLLKRLDCSGIVKLFDTFAEDQRAYLVLEYVPGQTLKEIVEKTGTLSEEEVLEYADRMCDILGYLHSQSPLVVHRDFTPDNLIVAHDGRLKLIDFMIAQERDAASTSEVVGKYHYMPPEQFRGRETEQTDIYALGCTLYFLLVGHDPEPISQSVPISEKRDISEQLNDTIAKATALDPLSRWQNVSELKSGLSKARAEP